MTLLSALSCQLSAISATQQKLRSRNDDLEFAALIERMAPPDREPTDAELHELFWSSEAMAALAPRTPISPITPLRSNSPNRSTHPDIQGESTLDPHGIPPTERYGVQIQSAGVWWDVQDGAFSTPEAAYAYAAKIHATQRHVPIRVLPTERRTSR